MRATESLLTLLPRLSSIAADRPLIAAGGIADGRAAAAAFVAGASAVCVGTRLAASEESAAHLEYKMRLVASQPEDTVITTLFGPEWPGAPMRVLINNAVRRALAPAAERSPLEIQLVALIDRLKEGAGLGLDGQFKLMPEKEANLSKR